jgi:hypothetical protein
MAPSLALGGLQRWMQTVIVHPRRTGQALASPEAASLVPPERLGEVVLSSATLDPADRVGIYHDMYLARMEEALESDYPGLAHFLGPQRWHRLVRGYVEAHPSRSYTLNALGHHLPDHVFSAPRISHAGFCRDLARLEWAITEAFDAPETPVLSEEQLAAVEPDAWEGARLVPTAAFRLLALDYDASSYLDSLRDEDHDHPLPRRHPSWVAVCRRDYSVYRVPLTRPGHRLLEALAEGRSVGEAVEECLRRSRPRPTGEQVFGWFRDWARAAAFQAVEV